MINMYINDILNSLENGNYFSALALALALPDMCGAAEFPGETSVAKRYIGWYDKFIGDCMKTETPVTDLNGELIYNLRNQFLHSGSTDIDVSKVKNESNVLDKFIFVLGDGSVCFESYIFQTSLFVSYRELIVDVTYLCKLICYHASRYYNNNRERFEFKISVLTQKEYFNPDPRINKSKVIVDTLNDKLKEQGSDWRIKDYSENNSDKI